MITIEDLNPRNFPLIDSQRINLMALAEKLTHLEDKFGSLLKITSGFRSIEDQYRVYREKGVTDPKKVPLGSQHLRGNAADIYDLHKSLQEWCLGEKGLICLEELDLYCEAFDHTPNWVHFQQVSPHSGKRFFIP